MAPGSHTVQSDAVQVMERMRGCKHEETDWQLAQQLAEELQLPYTEVSPWLQ